ncbi:MAG: monovalent cation/H(+) antiporter subunit G [Actinomycetota bacterium]
MDAVIPWLADALVVLGVFVMTIGIYGMIWMPDTYTKVHAASKVVFLGVVSLLVSSTVTGDADIIVRCALIAVFLLLTTPVSAHVIAKSAFEKEERMRTPGAVDESGRNLKSGVYPDDPR